MSKTPMEDFAEKYIDLYHKYSGKSKDAEPDTLDTAEFKTMIDDQFPHFVKQVHDPEALKKFFCKVDKNKDGKIDFVECTTLVGEFLVLCHEKFHKHEGGPHGHHHHH